MPQTPSIDYKASLGYVNAWAAFEHGNITDLNLKAHQFEGKLGSLNFQYSEQEGVLHVWAFVMPGAGPFVTKRSEIKATLDRIAKRQPQETAGGIFDIRTLDWNDHGSPRLEPSLYLLLDIVDGTVPPEHMVKRFDELSTAALIWNRHKMQEVLDAYWRDHTDSVK